MIRMLGEIIQQIVFGIGVCLVTIGAVFDLLAALGLVRFPCFYVRMHAATIGVIGGAVVPLIGVSLISLVSDQLGPYRFMFAGISFFTALLIMITAPVGTHILANAAHKLDLSPKEPIIVDKMGEDKR